MLAEFSPTNAHGRCLDHLDKLRTLRTKPCDTIQETLVRRKCAER